MIYSVFLVVLLKIFTLMQLRKKFLLFIDKIEYTIKFYIDLLISALFQMVQNNSLANSTDMSKGYCLLAIKFLSIIKALLLKNIKYFIELVLK